ncbi:MAG: hypothetical protein GY859_42820 [Desulfobacterales bacterium]|nr:hypothetical protein [Desulfobacterales bacterium]
MGRKSAVLPKARGVAAQTLEDAKSYGEEKINRARGESENFVQQIAAYQGPKRSPKPVSIWKPWKKP